MRLHQISPEQAISIDSPTCVVVVPIRCACLAKTDPAAYDHHTPTVEVTVNGMVISDAEVEFGTYSRDGEWVATTFSGTMPVFTSDGINDAIYKALNGVVEVWGCGVTGIAHKVQMEVDVRRIVTLVRPDGRIIQLAGAGRDSSPSIAAIAEIPATAAQQQNGNCMGARMP